MVREVPVAIVDLSHSSSSREFIQDFDASPDVRAAYYCNNLQEAEALVGKQAVHGVLYFQVTLNALCTVVKRRMWVCIVT